MNAIDFQTWLGQDHPRALVMGILNATPDSFSDGGRFADLNDAVEHARRMQADGADLLDIGGESTRPGSARVDGPEQIRRILPIIQAIRRESDIAISVDTTRSDVAHAAIDAGANILNDISAGREDEQMFRIAAARGLPLILMHMQGQPGTMQDEPKYGDVVAEVREFLASRANVAIAAGCARRLILLDPGIGFGKTIAHNLDLLRGLRTIGDLGFRVLIGTSRKRFIGAVTGVEQAEDRVIGSCVSAAWAVTQGATIVRAHDVKETVQAVRMAQAIAAAGE